MYKFTCIDNLKYNTCNYLSWKENFLVLNWIICNLTLAHVLCRYSSKCVTTEGTGNAFIHCIS